MGMTDSQYKDHLEEVKYMVEELHELKEKGDEEGYQRKYKAWIERLDRAIKR